MISCRFTCGYCEDIGRDGATMSGLYTKEEIERGMMCGLCGTSMYRDFSKKRTGPETGGAHVSESLFIHPEQEAEHRQHFPDIELTPDGSPIFQNAKQRSDYLDKRGIYKQPQRLR